MCKKASIKTAAVFLFIFTLCQGVFAQSGFPRIEPDPKAVEYYRAGGNNGHSWTALAEISLWASGDTSASNVEKIRSIIEAIKKSSDLPATDSGKAEFILGYMHKNLLKTYSIHQTRIDTLLSTGRFNCVSSAVLYTIICNSMGIQTSGIMTREHAFAVVQIGQTEIDVETTNAYGFDPGNRKEFHDSVGNVTGFAYVPPQNYRDRQKISRIELISLIMNNRISEAEKNNRFADAVPIAIDRAALLMGSELAVNKTLGSGALFEDPYKDLLDRVFNYGAMLLKAGREEDALRWAALASPRYPEPERWQELILAAVNNRMVKYTKANQMAEARKFIDSQKAILKDADYVQMDAVLIDAELLTAAQKIRSAAEGTASIDAITAARARGSVDEGRAAELLTFTVQKTAQVISASPGKDWRAAVTFIENFIKNYGSSRELEQSLQTYRSNLAGDYHNRFATAWNKRNYDEAERILNEGLAEFPNDRQLLANKEAVNKSRR